MFWGRRLCRNRLSPVVDRWRLSTLTGSLSLVRNSLPWLEKQEFGKNYRRGAPRAGAWMLV